MSRIFRGTVFKIFLAAVGTGAAAVAATISTLDYFDRRQAPILKAQLEQLTEQLRLREHKNAILVAQLINANKVIAEIGARQDVLDGQIASLQKGLATANRKIAQFEARQSQKLAYLSKDRGNRGGSGDPGGDGGSGDGGSEGDGGSGNWDRFVGGHNGGNDGTGGHGGESNQIVQ